jgi:DNA-directed RNA polymerase specialized sigma24 family protein
MVTPEPKPTHNDLAALRERMLPRARRGLQDADGEDLTQEALLRLVKEKPSNSPPPLDVRAAVKVRDVRAEFFRRQDRIPQPVEALEPAGQVSGTQEAQLAVIELLDVVERIAGPDAVEYAIWKTQGMTDADVSSQPGWDDQRTARARKRLARQREKLANQILRDEPEVNK